MEAEVGGGNSKHGGVNTAVAVAVAEIEEGRGVEEAGPAAAPEGERDGERERVTEEKWEGRENRLGRRQTRKREKEINKKW